MTAKSIRVYLEYIRKKFGQEAFNYVSISRSFCEGMIDASGLMLPIGLLIVYENVTRLGEFHIHSKMGDSVKLNQPIWYDGQYWNFLGSICYDAKNQRGNELRMGKDGRLLEIYYPSECPHRMYSNINKFVELFIKNKKIVWTADEFRIF